MIDMHVIDIIIRVMQITIIEIRTDVIIIYHGQMQGLQQAFILDFKMLC